MPATEWCALTELYHFQVGYNDLTGAFPVCLLKMAGMQTMVASDNDQFSAWSLPSSPASSLKYVHVHNSNLGGTVPATEWCTGLTCRNTSCVLDALSISASISVVQKCGSGEGPHSALSMAGGSTMTDALGSTIAAPPVTSGATLANSAVTGHVTVTGTLLSAAVATSLLRQ